MALEELGAQGTDLAEMVQVSYFILRRREKEENGSRSHFAPPSRGTLAHFVGNRRRAGGDDVIVTAVFLTLLQQICQSCVLR